MCSRDIWPERRGRAACIFGFEPLEKALDAAPAFVAVDDAVLLKIGQIGERHFHVDIGRFGIFDQLLLCPGVLRPRKRLDRTAVKRKQRIRDDKAVIDADRVAKTLARRARAKRRIKAEKMRLRLLVTRAVVFADKAVGEFATVFGSVCI